MTLIPILSLGIYVVLALKIFKEDKVAYVFDSSSNISSSLATQLKTQLNSILSTSRTLFQDYLFQYQFTDISKKLFEGESGLEALAVFKIDSQLTQPEQKAVLEKDPGFFDKYWKRWGSQSDTLLKKSLKNPRMIEHLVNDDRLLIIESAQNSQRSETYIFVIVYQASEMREIFSENSTMQALLVNSGGKVFFGPSDIEGTSLQQSIPLSFLEQENPVSQGAETVRISEGHDLLASYAKVGFADLWVVTTVDQNHALSAAQILVRKSYIFFIIMISFTAIVSLLASRSVTEALTSLFNATQKVSEGRFDFKVDVKSNDEIGTLAQNFNLMAQEVSRLLDQTAEKARMENELQTAKTVQETLFPETKNKIGNLEIAGFYEPASECGGDWWHYCQVGDRVFLWIGDATGHGAPAALITSAAKSASAIIERLDVTPAQAMELLNRCIYDVSKGKIMMTFFLASYDLKTSILTYANASHEAPFLIRKSESPLKKKDLIALNEVKSPRLGQDRDTVYDQVEIKVEKGDMVFFYTDGIQDIRNTTDEAWGEREFIKSLVQANKDFPSAADSSERFSTQFQEFRHGTQLIDDVTFFVIKNTEV